MQHSFRVVAKLFSRCFFSNEWEEWFRIKHHFVSHDSPHLSSITLPRHHSHDLPPTHCASKSLLTMVRETMFNPTMGNYCIRRRSVHFHSQIMLLWVWHVARQWRADRSRIAGTPTYMPRFFIVPTLLLRVGFICLLLEERSRDCICDRRNDAVNTDAGRLH